MSEKAVVFKINEEDYGIPISFVISIEKIPETNPIPQLPSFVKGIVKVRDELLPAIDLEELLYGSQLNLNEISRMIVLKTDKLSIGLFVREAKEIIDIPAELLKKVALMGYKKTKFFSGVANLEKGLITMIDPDLLVESLENIDAIQEYVENYEMA
ncbi:chemotaxis protein CheW [Falsibacillus pallidus]|uniref:Chemotaxis protein CheW n=1 Tax=Falsibacillus pallidus TaxID=493781 RepID=A0A370GDQ1_9BACI|nr:chemotaxis protein CheW [Falsibacillus pallidus]RDI41229.1 purine-binding chemotaxis protein CheW [Falsibacillus pallidus]